jgi:hypothetical protein
MGLKAVYSERDNEDLIHTHNWENSGSAKMLSTPQVIDSVLWNQLINSNLSALTTLNVAYLQASMESNLSLKFQKSISDIEHKYSNTLYIQWLIDIINGTVSYFVVTEKNHLRQNQTATWRVSNKSKGWVY